MRAVVLVGGGKVGGYLADQLVGTGHVVTVIEGDAATATRLAEETEALVIHGDGTDIEILRSAKVERAHWLLAVTGLDEVNLVACELAATLGADRTLARLNSPGNRRTFDALGIRVVGVTDLIGEVIEHELERQFLERITLLGAGAVSVIEIEVVGGAEPRPVDSIDLPSETLVITIVRPDGRAIVPGGDTLIRAGDRVVAVTALDNEPQVRDVLSGREF